jgi:type IX secretion system PorP/SprF family membrane protein
MKKLLPIAGVAIMLSCSAMAQDVHFTQYFTSPLTLNPAMTGLVAEDVRVGANYRQQWTSVSPTPYVTGTASFEIACLKGKLPEGDALGAGLMVLYDKSGTGGLTNITAGFSLAYHKGFGWDRRQHISIGMQAYYVQKSLDFTKLTFGDMYLPGSGLIGTTHQTFPNTTLAYSDINGGIMYSGKVADHATAYIGYSYYHLTSPVETFMKDDHPMHARQTVYLGGSFDVNENTIVYTSGLFQAQASSTEIVLGAAVGFIMNPGHDVEYQKNTVFYLGGWYRYGDAFCPYVGFEWSKVRVGLSYDVNLSNFTPATHGAGAYELSILFFAHINKKESNPQYNWSCPKVF